MKLRDLMTSEVYFASPSDCISEVAAQMKRHNVGAIPICEDGSLVGIVTDRDIVIECMSSGASPRDCMIGTCMTSGVITAPPEMELTEAVRLMGKEQVHRLPVLEDGRLVGIVSIGDIAAYCRDDKLVAQLLRDISTPVRSAKTVAMAA